MSAGILGGRWPRRQSGLRRPAGPGSALVLALALLARSFESAALHAAFLPVRQARRRQQPERADDLAQDEPDQQRQEARGGHQERIERFEADEDGEEKAGDDEKGDRLSRRWENGEDDQREPDRKEGHQPFRKVGPSVGRQRKRSGP